MSTWTHKVPVDPDHPVEPHYNGNGLTPTGQRSFWSCHKCGGPLQIDGLTVPIASPIAKAKDEDESKMSSQP